VRSDRAISRHYVEVGAREVHYRRCGAGAPVVLLHESPLSSLAYEPLMRCLGERFTAIALDTPGYGNSDPLPAASPSISDYADALAQTLDALGVPRCGLYGAHTGACIALELALRAPDRVAALVLDGLLLATEPERRELLARYCPALEPEIDGSHLVAAWAMRRDMHVFFPWYDRRPAAALRVAMPDAETLHRGMFQHLRAGAGYHLGYEAAFRYDPIPALAALSMPAAVVAAPTDVLFDQLSRLPAQRPPTLVVASRPAEPEAAASALAGHLAAAAGLPAPPPAPAAPPRADRITRAYAATSAGTLHLRQRAGGPGRPLVLVHGSPTSAAMLEPLMARLARSRPVYAFDTLGNGDSDKPAGAGARSPGIAEFAAVLAAAIDDVGLHEFDLYGTHTGAAIAVETSLRAPERVGRMILDGVAMFDEATVGEFLERYFVDLTPASDGSHLLRAWSCARDSTIWFPWYRRDGEHRYRTDVYEADALHRYVIEFLASGSSYALPYRAAFTYRAAERLPLVGVPALVACHREDPLACFLDDAASICPGAVKALLPDDPDATAAAYERFLDDTGDGRA